MFSETISLMNKDEKTNEREFICINFFSITMFKGLYLKKQFYQIGKYEYANINISRERKVLQGSNMYQIKAYNVTNLTMHITHF